MKTYVSPDEEDRLDADLLSADLHEFVRAAWHLIEPATPLSDGWYIKAICDHLQAVTEGRIKKLIINQPPRTAKSSLVSVLWPCWEWTRDPSLRWMFASYAMKLSLRDSLRRREAITSEWYQARWGETVQLSREQREKSNFKNTTQGVMYCTSTGGMVTGMGGKRLVLDDCQDPQGAESEIQSETTIDWLNMTWPSRRDGPDATEVMVQQRLTERDATALFMRQGGWTLLKIPMEFEGDKNATSIGFVDPRSHVGEVLDPKRFPPDYLEDLKVRLGPYGTAGQLQMRPAPQEGGIIKRAWLRPYDEADNGTKLSIMDGQYVYEHMRHFRFATVDTATTEPEVGGTKKGMRRDPDYTVMAAWSVFQSTRGPVLSLLDLLRERMEGPEILPKLKAFHDIWDFHIIAMENVGERSLFQFAKRQGLPMRDINTSEDALVQLAKDFKDKTARAYYCTPMMADGRFFIPRYTTWVADYIRELTVFPNAGHDDQLDVTAFAVAVAQKSTGTMIDLYAKQLATPSTSGILPRDRDDQPDKPRRSRYATTAPRMRTTHPPRR